MRRFFSDLHKKLGGGYKKIHIERLSEDVCMIKRYPNNFEKAYVLIARLSYDAHAPPADLDVEVPGWVQKVKRVYYFRPDTEVLHEDIPRVRAQIVEQNSLAGFGCVFHKWAEQRGTH